MKRFSLPTILEQVLALSFVLALPGCSVTPSKPPKSERDVAQHGSRSGLDPQVRAEVLAAQMTLEEKIEYLGGEREFFIRAVPRLGIPEIKMADGPVGCRNWGPSTAYPASIGLAASFQPDLSESVGRSIARDCRARGVHILLAPGVNIQRSPLNGRNFEYLGEDPFLTSQSAVAFIRGVQAGGVMATVKHFVANNQEWDRNHVSSEVSERALHEIYLPAFEAAVTEARVGAVMTAYNPVNGTFASHNSTLLHDILRGQWGFKGLVMSDWRAVHDTLGAIQGGMDLEMPSAEFMTVAKVQALIAKGEVNESEIDEKVISILRALIAAGFLDRDQIVEAPQDDPASAAIALDAARNSLVLLKNGLEQAPLLPLDSERVKRLAVVGPNAHPAVHGGSGSAYVTPVHAVSLLEGLKNSHPDIEVRHHPGVQEYTEFSLLGGRVFSGPVIQEIFAGKVLAGKPLHRSEVERIDFRPDGKSPASGVGQEDYSIRWKGKIFVEEDSSYQFMTNADDGVRVFLDGKLVLDDWSDHAPRMTTENVPVTKGEHEVVVEYFQGILGSICQFGAGPEVAPGDLHGEPQLKEAMTGADIVVVAVGYGQSSDTNSLGTSYPPFWPSGWARETGIVEAEDDDRRFTLPQAQLATLEAAIETGIPVVVVGYAGGGVDFEPWLSRVSALIWAWYPGQEGGTALSELLWGELNPSARLPVTFARHYSDHPAAASYSTRLSMPGEESRGFEARLESCEKASTSGPVAKHPKSEGELFLTPYCDDVHVGYRGFDRAGVDPLFPFGFGLSFSEFEFEEFQVNQSAQGIRVSLNLRNKSARPGREVVQIYTAAEHDEEAVPQKLAAFESVELAPGETKRVELILEPRAFSRYVPGEGWVQPGGSYEIRASSSSREHRLRQSVVVPAKGAEPLK